MSFKPYLLLCQFPIGFGLVKSLKYDAPQHKGIQGTWHKGDNLWPSCVRFTAVTLGSISWEGSHLRLPGDDCVQLLCQHELPTVMSVSCFLRAEQH